MADKHGHEHGHRHIGHADHDEAEPKHVDAAERSLSEALGISFVILKVIMIVLVVAYLASGFRTVGSNEQALGLTFGKISGVGEARVLDHGWHWVFPYPIGEIVRIPVKKQIKLTVDRFWYEQTRNDILGDGPKPRRIVRDKLNPIREGYCLTRSEKQTTGVAAGRTPSARGHMLDTDGSDYNIVHSRWEVEYQIDNIGKFFTNVYVEDLDPGEVYEDVMIESTTPLLRSVVENAVATAMVQYSIDEALQSRDTIPRYVRQLIQRQLNLIESGVRVTSVQLVDVEWPKQVNEAFEAYFTASQTSQQAISEARTYAEQTLTDTGGQVAEPLYQELMKDDPDTDQLAYLWSQVAGQSQDTLAQALAYRTKVVEAAKANANYLKSILPEFRKRPELVTQRLYLDTIEQVLQNADEKFILQPSTNLKGQEIRILVNRDPSLKPKQVE